MEKSLFLTSEAETEEEYGEELKNAIKFFGKSSEKSSLHITTVLSRFYLLFYRSFYTIVFEESDSKDEVNRYLTEARKTIEEFERNELFFEAIKNLTKALEKTQKIKNNDLRLKKSEINYYRKHFDLVEKLIKDAKLEHVLL